jgi:GT2 family glycosyltransferase
MPVHDPDLRDLMRAVESVRRQVWPAVELCIFDDASTDPEVLAYLESTSKQSGVQHRRVSAGLGIAGATNAALELASGNHVVFLDHDDELSESALSTVASVLRERPDLDFVYSDHDIVDENGARQQVFYKPDWSPELLLSYMYVGHIKVVRRSLALELQGFREGFDGAADYDFLLRLSEKTDRIQRVPEVLYHWRAAENSMARSSDTKTHAFESGRRAVAEALTRRGIKGAAEWPTWAQRARVGVYRIRFSGESMGKVSILIPTRDRLDLLRACIASIEERTDYEDWEILILDNDSREPATISYLEKTPHRVVHVPGEFNFSRIVNRGVEESRGEFVVLLNNDTIVVSVDWLNEMLGMCRMPGVAAVGAKLLFPDGRIQHAGVTLGVHGLTAHAFEGRRDGYAPLEVGFYAHVPRNVSAVTAACLMARRDVYQEIGGFDEEELAVAWNDTDFCLRLRSEGHRVVMNPLAELVHLGSASRGEAKNDREIGVMFERWRSVIEQDPYSNPNLSRLENDFRPRTQLDERSRFHYAPDGFRANPGSISRSADERVDRDDLSPAALLEICRNQALILDQISARLAAFETISRLGQHLITIPIVARLASSHRLRGIGRRLIRWGRSPKVRRWSRRLGRKP